MSEFSIGIAGLGRWGRNYLATLSRLPGCRVRAVSDPVLSSRRGELGCQGEGLRCYFSTAEMLKDNGLDGVVIATPETTHFPLAELALSRGKHVLVEKPMALTVTEARQLLRHAGNAGLVLAVGHTALYLPGFSRLWAAVRSGRLGRLQRMLAVRTSAGPGSAGRNPAVRGPLWDLAAHDIAMAVALLGTPVAGRCRAGDSGTVGQAATASAYELAFAGGVVLRGRCRWQAGPARRAFIAIGTRGRCRCTENRIGPFEQRPLTRQCADFIGACRNHTTPFSSAALGLIVTASLAALSAAAATPGRWQTIDEPCHSDRGVRCSTIGIPT